MDNPDLNRNALQAECQRHGQPVLSSATKDQRTIGTKMHIDPSLLAKAMSPDLGHAAQPPLMAHGLVNLVERRQTVMDIDQIPAMIDAAACGNDLHVMRHATGCFPVETIAPVTQRISDLCVFQDGSGPVGPGARNHRAGQGATQRLDDLVGNLGRIDIETFSILRCVSPAKPPIQLVTPRCK